MESLSSCSEYSIILPLEANFVLENAHLTWAEIAWGYQMGLIGWHALKEFALAVLKAVPHPSDESLSKLASITKESVGDAGEFVRSIAARSPKLDTVATPKNGLTSY